MTVGPKATMTAIALGAALSFLPTVSYAQEADRDRLATAEARLDVLETTVADLEGHLAALEGAANIPVPAEQGMPTPSPAATTPGESSRDQPIPIGASAKVGDWTLAVVSVTPVADEVIVTESTLNAPPETGYQFFLVTLSMTYEGAESATPGSDLIFEAIGNSDVTYNRFSPSCGVIPDDLILAGEVFAGGTIEANICFPVKPDDAASLVMYVEPLLSLAEARTWFALHDGTGSTDG